MDQLTLAQLTLAHNILHAINLGCDYANVKSSLDDENDGVKRHFKVYSYGPGLDYAVTEIPDYMTFLYALKSEHMVMNQTWYYYVK